MLFVFHKNKIISYTIAASIVIVLFLFSISFMPNSNIQLIQVSSNVINAVENNEIQNNNLKIDNTYN